jgi:hypothetical protein
VALLLLQMLRCCGRCRMASTRSGRLHVERCQSCKMQVLLQLRDGAPQRTMSRQARTPSACVAGAPVAQALQPAQYSPMASSCIYASQSHCSHVPQLNMNCIAVHPIASDGRG